MRLTFQQVPLPRIVKKETGKEANFRKLQMQSGNQGAMLGLKHLIPI